MTRPMLGAACVSCRHTFCVTGDAMRAARGVLVRLRMLRRRGCAPFVSPSPRKPRCRPNPRIATVANRPKTKTPGVYVAHQRRCPAFKSAARRAAGAFARDVDPVRIPATVEQDVAEKLHAYTRTYASERPSSRIKDLVDLVVSRTPQSSTPNAWMTRSTRSPVGGGLIRAPPPCLRPRTTGRQGGDGS